MKILFITSNRIGDAVLSTGLLGWLMDAHPNAEITIACGPLAAPLFRPAPQVARVIAMPKRKRGGHWLDLWKQTVTTRWDLIVDLRASAIAYLLPTKRRAIFRAPHSWDHKVVQLGRVLDLPAPPAPRLWNNAGLDAKAAELIPQGPILAIGPTSNWGGKQWPAAKFAEAALRLTGPEGLWPGAKVALFGGPGEEDSVRALIDAIPQDRRINLIGALPLDLVAACLKRCDFYLGNDSGLMHMAAAQTIPTLGLFGPSEDRIYGPWGPRGMVLRTPRSCQEIQSDPSFDHRSQASLTDSITVDQVVAAAADLWRKSR